MAEEIQEEVEVLGPGAMLKARRESLQLSIEEIAEKLHLRPAVVTELEEDVIDHSVSMTFTKGYVRLYAKHLEMDPTPVLAAFDELANPIKQPAKLQSFSQRVAKQASDTRLMILSYFILFAIIAMAVIWWFQQPEESASDSTTTIPSNSLADSNQQPSPTSSQPEPETSIREVVSVVGTQVEDGSSTLGSIPESPANDFEAVLEETVEQGASLSAGDAVQGVADSGTEETELLVTDEPQELVSEALEPAANTVEPDNEANEGEREPFRQTSASMEPVVQANVDTNSGSDIADFSQRGDVDSQLAESSNFQENFDSAEPITQELVFTFEQDCWMNLTDATGENIAYGVKNAGRVMPVSGIPPFEVVLGAPQGVAITVDGVPFDMSAFPAGRTARFIIGSQAENQENFDTEINTGAEANTETAESTDSGESSE